MIYGILNNEKVEANPNIKNALCQCCGSLLTPKCGSVKIWHFAHKIKSNCSAFNSNKMTEWHKSWQNQFPKENREVVYKCQDTGEKHIADVSFSINNKNIVLEFQNSPIKDSEVISREKIYKNLYWVLNGENYKIYKQKQYLDINLRSKHTLFYENNKFYINNYGTIREVPYDNKYNLTKKQIDIGLHIRENGTFHVKTKSNFFNNAKKDVVIDFNDNTLGLVKYVETVVFQVGFIGYYYLYGEKKKYMIVETIDKKYFIEIFNNLGQVI